jgi:hypothetical protein
VSVVDDSRNPGALRDGTAGDCTVRINASRRTVLSLAPLAAGLLGAILLLRYSDSRARATSLDDLAGAPVLEEFSCVWASRPRYSLWRYGQHR